MKGIFAVGLILVCIYLFCKDSSPKDKNFFINSNTTIVAFGDSITYGYGVKKEDNYPSILSNLLGASVVNSGVSGEVTQKGLERLLLIISKVNPSLVILCHGANDILRGYDDRQTKENIAKMIEIIENSGAKVVLIGVPNFKGESLETAAFYKELAKEKGVALEDRALAKILNDPYLKIDPIHPDKDGYEKLAKALYNLLESAFNIEKN